jgi:aspartate aminotransferase
LRVTEEERLAEIRREIQRVTEEIIGLTADRMRLSQEAGLIKETRGRPLEDIEVERRLKSAVRAKSVELGVDPDFAQRLLNILISRSVGVQRNVTSRGGTSPVSIYQQAKQLEKDGQNIIHLEVGEPDFPPPPQVIASLKKAVDEGHIGYSEPGGIEPLRRAVAEHLNDKFGIDLSKDEVLITPGARFALYLAASIFLRTGGGALIFEPAYPAYRRLVDIFEGRPNIIQATLEDDWTPDTSIVEDSISQRPDLMILNYPTNPTGKVLSDNTFTEILDQAAKKDVPVISDEVYRDYSFKTCPSILKYTDCRSIFISSFSKSYSMTGFRIGYAVASREDIERMTRIQSVSLTCIPEFIQRAAISALECEDELTANIGKIHQRTNYSLRLLEELPFICRKPDGGLYLFPKIDRPGFDGDKYATNLLEKQGVAVTPGSAFGDYQDYLRISLCQPEERLEEAFRRMRETL